jgi:hypothetical protein
MVNYEDYSKSLRDLYESAAKPFRDLARLQSTYEDALRPYRQLEELYNHSNVAREALRYRDWHEELIRHVRPVVTDLNTSLHIAAAMRTPTSLALVEQQRRLISTFEIPQSYRSAMEEVARVQLPGIRYNSEIDRLLEALRPYADAAPSVPDEETLAAVRERVAEILSANAGKAAGAVTALLTWLTTNSRSLEWSKISFILFTIVYPFLLTVYQDELKRTFHHQTPVAKHRAVERELVAAVTARLPMAALANVRYVGQQTLNVRSASRRNSSKVTELHFGDVVVVVRSTKDWTLVEFDVDDAQIRAWVLTRGLKRFNMKGRSAN